MAGPLSNLIVFFTAFSILAFELTFMRIFAYAQWHNLSALIITLALQGFGISGAVITVFRDAVARRFNTCLKACLLLIPLSLGLGFTLAVRLTFNPYELSLAPGQVLTLLCYFSLMGLPFFWGGAVTCLIFIRRPAAVTYFFNLTGAGAGTLAVLGAAFFLHPYDMAAGVLLFTLVPVAAVAAGAGPRFRVLAVVTLFILAAVRAGIPDYRSVSQFKALSAALTLPNARVIHESYSPRSVIQVVEAKGFRSTAGLSLTSPFQVPVQKGIFFNADAPSPVTPFSGDLNSVRYLGRLSAYLAFDALPESRRRKVLVVGTGGGEALLRARLSGFDTIHGIEADNGVIRLMTGPLADFSGHIYTREPVRVFRDDARNFIRKSRDRYDLIDLTLPDAYNTSVSGVSALNETYLYTVEALGECLTRLTNSGVLSLTRWIATPARDNPKLFQTAVTSLRQSGITEPGNYLMAIRSLQTVTLLVSRSPLSGDVIRRGKAFALRCGFDLIWYPGMDRTEANRFIRMETPVFRTAMEALLSPDAAVFAEAYPFDIWPAVDNRPYFHNFFKPAVLGLIREFGPAQIPVTEWGYLVLVLLLVPVTLVSSLMILLPLPSLPKSNRQGPRWIFPFFALIGTGYFFIEMPLIQKLVKFLGHPSYSLSVTIAGLLISSGAGSYYSARLFPEARRMAVAVFAILLLTALTALGSGFLFSNAADWPLPLKLVLVLAAIAPLGFFMGFPFPLAMERIRQTRPGHLAWAFGINGFFSVISILTATLLAVLFGFHLVFSLAMVCYAAAGLVWAGSRHM